MQTAADIGNEIEALRQRSDELQRQGFGTSDHELAFELALEADQEMFELIPTLAGMEAKTPEDVIAKLHAIQSQLALLEMSNDPEAVDHACRSIHQLVATALDGMVGIKVRTARFLNTKEAAAYLGFTPGTLENWRVSGVGPKFVRARGKKRGPVRYAVDELDEWMRANTFGSTTEAQFKLRDIK